MPGTITIANDYGSTFFGVKRIRNAYGTIPKNFRLQILQQQNGYHSSNRKSPGNYLFNKIQGTRKYRRGGFISSKINRISRNRYKRKMRVGGLLRRRKKAGYSRPSYRTGGITRNRFRNMRRR